MNNSVFVGNLTRDPELRFSAEGKPRASFAIAINESRGESERTHFLNFTAFGTLAENVAASLHKGERIVVAGRVDTYPKEVQIEGADKKLTMVSFVANAVGPDLRWATAQVTKTPFDSDKPAVNAAVAAKPAVAPAAVVASDEF